MRTLFALLLLLGLGGVANAQTTCTSTLNQTQVLSSFADSSTQGITARNLRDYVCSNAAGSVPITTLTSPTITNGNATSIILITPTINTATITSPSVTNGTFTTPTLSTPTIGTNVWPATPGSANQLLTSQGGSGTMTWTSPTTTVAGIPCTLGSSCALTAATSGIAVDIPLNNVSNFFDGPQVAQGNTGTWFATGTANLIDIAGAAQFQCKLWDGGANVRAAAVQAVTSPSNTVSMGLSGVFTSPTGNIRISCRDTGGTSGFIRWDATGLGINTSTQITVIRLN